ncbi:MULTISPECIES: acyl carrier protein [unclassified Pseudomonas]|uniref:acyl carrier protein n=1 Tax=unclassified Pseudomonas TaxID=196821 RepID=UPI0039B7329C
MTAPAVDALNYTPPPLSSVTRDTVGDWIYRWLLDRDYGEDLSMSIDTPFSEVGMTSMDAVELAAELSQVSKVPLDSTIAWHYPTPGELAGYVAATAKAGTPAVQPSRPIAEPAVDKAGLGQMDEQAMMALLESLLGPKSPTAHG